ncbi:MULTISPECIES: threonine synthase [Corynebacterium]|uniref:threonine synthase n=1 Tax=Corynebacterium TaxID=1716 RepID=UPI0008A3990C|nr:MULTISPECIES: threonine synthase [Corynebacterium]OFT89773.1 threonine synthase [Corynebacterium sp. HMSC28B08]
MDFISTRDAARTPVAFTDILLSGLAPDGGLYLPAEYPQLTDEILTQWRELLQAGNTTERTSYAALAAEILKLFVDDIPPQDLEAIAARAYTTDKFSSADIVPLTTLEDGILLGHLSEGPTAAFKDMAMQLLGELFEYELARRGETLNILGATSGDTGSSAEYAMRGRDGIRVFMLTPAGRMTPFQQAQMFSLDDPNIFNIALDGVFDDCQDIVKEVSSDANFKRDNRIGAVNSINWARLMAQIVYYVACWLRATDSNDQKVSFSVPTGNFGDICAGHIARQMGLPIDRLIVATNENDVLDEFFRTGDYTVRSAAQTHATSSPSMDISRASNFERFIFDLLGRDAKRTADLFGVQVKQGGFSLAQDPVFAAAAERYGFLSASSTHADRVACIADAATRLKTFIDPHTADGVNAARAVRDQVDTPIVVLETALPVKFSETIVEATGKEPQVPARFADIMNGGRHVKDLPNDATVVKQYILDSIAQTKEIEN